MKATQESTLLNQDRIPTIDIHAIFLQDINQAIELRIDIFLLKHGRMSVPTGVL